MVRCSRNRNSTRDDAREANCFDETRGFEAHGASPAFSEILGIPVTDGSEPPGSVSQLMETRNHGIV
jgi:hypothetical protein